MTMTLEEILHTCPDWDRFCRLHGYSEWVVNEGGGDIHVELTLQQAHRLGILKLRDMWMVQPVEEVYPDQEEAR